ncbi:Druantia anti-phage system protein DruA, partial [Desulfobacula sp.]|uniref:Druantia anti-phage system protein DruA n=1 Tax=Desulfobacula sp. TaxID=2593537 RepID=UPI002609E81C
MTLHRKGLLDYPPPRHTKKNKRKVVKTIDVDQTPITCNISDLGSVVVKMVRHTDLEPIYDSLVDQFHYLGYAQIVGNHLKYMAFAGDTPLACIGWGSAAWAVKSREEFIGWTKPVKNTNLHFVVNN